ncbi:MAG: bifunctional oligoribonuclease/PAP phosphatase NrnA [Armatimonadota bacterium]
MMTNEFLRESWAKILENHSFVIACHQRPDGDTLGSALALARVLKHKDKDVVVLCEDGLPDTYSFIPESETVQIKTDRRDFDAGILVDSESPKRVGSAYSAIESAKVHICIDHHIPDEEFGDIRIVDKNTSSTAEIVYWLLEANNVEIDDITASQLLTGLISDTGAFRFTNTSPRTFEIAAKLAKYGADPAKISNALYESKPLRTVKLLGRALNNIKEEDNSKIVWSTISQNDLAELGASDSDTETIVNQINSIKNAKVAMFFRETPDGKVRVSIRTKNGIDANMIARAFDGGGHKAAAGCTLDGPLETAPSRLIKEVRNWMVS